MLGRVYVHPDQFKKEMDVLYESLIMLREDSPTNQNERRVATWKALTVLNDRVCLLENMIRDYLNREKGESPDGDNSNRDSTDSNKTLDT